MSKKQRIGALLACAALCLPGIARADVWKGTTYAAETEEVRASAEGVLESFALRVGQYVKEDTFAGQTKENRVFAPFDGRVISVQTMEGEETGQLAVLTLEPVSPYEVVCSVKKAHKTPENTTLRPGQQVWVRCAADGSHRALGRVTKLEGEEFRLEILGGELFIGEAVFVFREGSFSDADLLGTGTVIESDAVESRASGTVLRMCVAPGEEVERGQLLYTTASSSDPRFFAEAEGWVTETSSAEGKEVKENDAVATIATAVQITVQTDKAALSLLKEGTRLSYWRADDPHTLLPCAVSRLLYTVGSEELTAEIAPLGEELLPVGLTVYVTDEKEEGT